MRRGLTAKYMADLVSMREVFEIFDHWAGAHDASPIATVHACRQRPTAMLAASIEAQPRQGCRAVVSGIFTCTLFGSLPMSKDACCCFALNLCETLNIFLDTRVVWQARCSCGHVRISHFSPTCAGEIDQKAQRVLLGQKAQTKAVATRTIQEVAQIRRLCCDGVAACPPRKRSGAAPPRPPALTLAAPAASNLWTNPGSIFMACLASSALYHLNYVPAAAELRPGK